MAIVAAWLNIVANHLLQIARLFAYLAVIGVGAFIAASHGRRRRAGIAALFIYLGVVYAVALITQKEMWPFGNYQALHGTGRLDVYIWRIDFVGVDRTGHEWILDPWAFDSVYRIPLQMWANAYMKRLPVDQQHEALAWMLNAAERSRERLAAGKRVGAARWLGAFALPNWYGLKRISAVSPEPFTALRLYEVEWTAARQVDHRWLYAEYALR